MSQYKLIVLFVLIAGLVPTYHSAFAGSDSDDDTVDTSSESEEDKCKLPYMTQLIHDRSECYRQYSNAEDECEAKYNLCLNSDSVDIYEDRNQENYPTVNPKSGKNSTNLENKDGLMPLEEQEDFFGCMTEFITCRAEALTKYSECNASAYAKYQAAVEANCSEN